MKNFTLLFFKSILLSCTITMVSMHVATAQKKQIEVYLIGGQSNATGQGYLANMADTMKIAKNVMIFHSGSPHLNSGLPAYQWQALHQASESPDRFGIELGFGTTLAKLRPERNIAIIKHAHSATNLYQQWNPGKNGNDTANQGEQYKEFIHTVKTGLDSLLRLGYTPILKGMLWQQGESDADKGRPISSNYGKNLQHFIYSIRKDLNAKKLLFIYGYVYPTPNTGEGITDVRKAQHDIDQNAHTSISVKRAFVVDTEGLSLRANDPNTRYPKDIIHFGTSGTWNLGVRMATLMHTKL